MLVCRSGIDLTAVFGLSLVLAAGCGGSNLGGTPPRAAQTWGNPVEIDAGLTTASSPRIAVDRTTGDAFAVWLQGTGSRTALFVSRLLKTSTTWSPPEIIDAGDVGGNAASPDIVADGNGGALVIWLQRDAGVISVFVNRFDGAWQGAASIDTLAVPASNPRIAVGGSGIAAAVWLQADGSDQGLFASRFQGAGWDGPTVLDTLTPDASSPSVAVAANGDTFVVWVQQATTGGTPRVRASRRPAAATLWGTHFNPIDDGVFATAVTEPSVVADVDGNALVIWRQSTGGPQRVRSARFLAGPSGDWMPTVTVSDGTTTAEAPALAANDDGTAVAVWQAFNGVRRDIVASRFTPIAPAGAWSAPAFVETSDLGSATNPQVAVDSVGNAFAIWQQANPGLPVSIFASRLDASASTWGDTEPVENDNANLANAPQVAVDVAGDAVAVWVQLNSIFANTRP